MRTLANLLGLTLLLAVAAPLVAYEDKKEEKKSATLIIRVANANARLWVDDEEQEKAGLVRTFRTPPLTVGREYTYQVKSFWEPNNYTKITRTRKVTVEAGKMIKLDLTREDPSIPDDIRIRYVPTPPAFVDKMLEVARVTDKDVVFDLGCGDGRLVVTAVSKFKARRGVGVDIDPTRINESKENAKKAGVAEKVEFRVQDVMKVPDLEKATVVTLYLADELNEQLWPVLQKRLPNGARIVTHRFLMGKNTPEQSWTLTARTDWGTSYTNKIHLWTVKREGGK
jgi:uncharacterized protein (TIGR03000 family)